MYTDIQQILILLFLVQLPSVMLLMLPQRMVYFYMDLFYVSLIKMMQMIQILEQSIKVSFVQIWVDCKTNE
jgi:hypothetical protein